MRRLCLLLVLFAVPAGAHPSVSVVFDSRGNLYYSDLHRVWKVAAGGAKTVAVPNVHTHELAVDAGDNLYGEHLWYEGEATDRWGHYVWKRSPEGVVTKVIPNREGFLTNYSFARDRQGNMYWTDREANAIRKRSPDGRVTTLATRRFTDARFMTVTPDSVVYFIDSRDLVRVSPRGAVTVVARNLTPWSLTGYRHTLQGLTTDRAGNVYVAHSAGRESKRISPSGEVRVVDRSRGGWRPSGVGIAPDGALWVLEYSPRNEVRVRRAAG